MPVVKGWNNEVFYTKSKEAVNSKIAKQNILELGFKAIDLHKDYIK